jgi:hypothetical protein
MAGLKLLLGMDLKSDMIPGDQSREDDGDDDDLLHRIKKIILLVLNVMFY